MKLSTWLRDHYRVCKDPVGCALHRGAGRWPSWAAYQLAHEWERGVGGQGGIKRYPRKGEVIFGQGTPHIGVDFAMDETLAKKPMAREIRHMAERLLEELKKS